MGKGGGGAFPGCSPLRRDEREGVGRTIVDEAMRVKVCASVEAAQLGLRESNATRAKDLYGVFADDGTG